MSEGRRITFVSHTSKPGGGELALRRYLERTDLPVHLVTLEGGGVWDGLEATCTVASGLRGLRAAVDEHDLVVANSMRAAFLTSLVLPREVRLAYWVRDGLLESAMSRLALGLTRHVTARRVSFYLANSRWTARTIIDALGVAPRRVHVVPSMCDVSEERLAAGPRTHVGQPLRLLYLGRIAEWKAPHVAVQALSRLRARGWDVTLTVAGGDHFGESAYAQRLSQMVQRDGIRMLGHVEDVHGLLRAHDVLLHCSSIPEPFGQVLIQAMAHGVPVAATGAGGPVELLEDAPVQVLYPALDPEALASTVERLVAHYPNLSRWSWERAHQYSDAELARRTDQILATLGGG